MRHGPDRWSKYWESRSNEDKPSWELDRGRSIHDQEIEDVAERQLLSFIDPKKNECILDAGCGTGINLRRLHTRAKRIVGMDYAEGMINRAQQRIREESLADVSILRGNMASIGLKHECFDKIICISVMQYLGDKDCESAIREFIRLAKDGGQIIIHIKNLSSLYVSTLFVAKRMKRWFTKSVLIPFYRSYAWYEAKLEELGAEVREYEAYNIFQLDFLPRKAGLWLERVERLYYTSRFLRKHGADYFIKATVHK